MTKIDIISGFLGAGKTTLIKKLLLEALKGQQVVLIENEFGQIGIDGGFLEEAGIEIKEMNSGCICCSLVGDFATALKEVIETYHPDRIMIEPSGVGKLSDVISAVTSIADQVEIEINTCVTVVDAKKCKTYLKNFGEFFANQIENGTAIVLSRTGELEPEKMEACLALVREHNKDAVVVTTPWDLLEGDELLATIENGDSLLAELNEEMKKEGHEHEHEEHEHGENCGCHDHEHHNHEHHHDHGDDCTCGCHDHNHNHEASEVFTSFGMETVRSYTKEEIIEKLDKLDNGEYGTILRAKGIVAGENGEFIHFDYVPEELEVRDGKASHIGKICVIGSDIDEEKLKLLF